MAHGARGKKEPRPKGSFDDENVELEGSDGDMQRPHFFRQFRKNNPYLFIIKVFIIVTFHIFHPLNTVLTSSIW